MVQLTKLSNSAYHTACTQFSTKRLIEIEFRINDVKLSFVLERKLNVTSFALAVCVCYLYELDPNLKMHIRTFQNLNWLNSIQQQKTQTSATYTNPFMQIVKCVFYLMALLFICHKRSSTVCGFESHLYMYLLRPIIPTQQFYFWIN